MFGKKSKKIMKKIWIVITILVIVSMVLLYAPIF